MSIREVLEEAGRYYDCFNILHNIINEFDEDTNYPCPHKDDNGERKERIKGKLIIDEASKLLTLIQSNQEVDRTKYNFNNLRSYISFKTNIMLHNYAVDISHHNDPDDDMETIRDFLVLENLLDCWCISDDKFFWTIPETWKKSYCKDKKLENKKVFVIKISLFHESTNTFTLENTLVANTLDTAIKVAREEISHPIIRIESHRLDDCVELYFDGGYTAGIKQVEVYK